MGALGATATGARGCAARATARRGAGPGRPHRRGRAARRGYRRRAHWLRGAGPARTGRAGGLQRCLRRPARRVPAPGGRARRAGPVPVRRGPSRGPGRDRGQVGRRGDDPVGAHLRGAQGGRVRRVPPGAAPGWPAIHFRADQPVHGRRAGCRDVRAGPGGRRRPGREGPPSVRRRARRGEPDAQLRRAGPAVLGAGSRLHRPRAGLPGGGRRTGAAAGRRLGAAGADRTQPAGAHLRRGAGAGAHRRGARPFRVPPTRHLDALRELHP